jgi:hypothetical protein
MIHDAKVEVTCDTLCGVGELLELRALAGGNYYYGRSDESIERELVKSYGWTCEDGKHYCPDCVEQRAAVGQAKGGR